MYYNEMYYNDILIYPKCTYNSNTGHTCDTISRYQIVVPKCTLYA